MILALDIGNKRLKWGRWDGSVFAATGALDWRASYGLQQLPREAPTSIVACTVAAPQAAQRVEQFCLSQWGTKPAYLATSRRCGAVTCAYDDPAELGADRWAGLLGAHALYPGDVCIIDCGTAVTVDVITASGQHLGGAITPGLSTMRAALDRDTHQLTDEPAAAEVLARSTASAIQGGTLLGLAGAVDRLVDEAERLSGLRLDCVITGGDGPALKDLLRRGSVLQPHLVLHGLLIGLSE